MKNETSKAPIKVLVLEDRSSDAELMMAQLTGAGFSVVWKRIETETDFLDGLNLDWDLIVADYQLPQFNAIAALRLLRKSGLDIPFIVVSGKVSDDFIVEAMKQGAADFLLKDRMARLGIAVEQALELKRLRMSQKEVELKLRQAVVELERNQSKLQVANHELAEKHTKLSELYLTAQRFMDDVSHEFRTPLSVIKGYSEIMKAGIAGPMSPEQGRYNQIIIDRTRDLAQMVDDLLDSSKLRAGVLRVDRCTSQVATIFAALHPIVDSRIAANKIQWVEEIEAGIPPVFADCEKATRVLVNLVVNAIKFSPEGSRILLSAKREGDTDVRISVTDEGPGISPEHLALIFDRFQQVGSEPSGGKGFGLGLNIAKELVSLNLGQMNVSSELRHGSTFSFTLPLKDPAVIVERLFKYLKNKNELTGDFAIVRVTPDNGLAATAALRGFLAASSHPGDAILPSGDGKAFITFGNSSKPEGWLHRLMKAGQTIEQFSPSQKLRKFSAEIVGTIPYPASLSEAQSMVLEQLQGELLHA